MAEVPPSYGPKECGSCRLWRPILEDERGPIGPCRLGVRTGDFPGTAPICERYLARGADIPALAPAAPARRRAPRPAAPLVTRGGEASRQGAAAPGSPAFTPAGAGPPVGAVPLEKEIAEMTREEFAHAIREVLREEMATVSLAPRWEGGTVLLKPGDPQTQAKEIPLDSLFHKVVMIRDRLRVLEQKINGHPKLSDAEKLEMQQYVTRCYGSLTSFNLLFREEKDRFVGEKGSAG